MDVILSFTSIALAFSFLLFLYNALILHTKNKKRAPEAAGAWPIIGHLHLLSGENQLLHRTLGAMADKYGPSFNIRLGTRTALVVSNWQVFKECFTINDKALASRPTTTATKLMGYNHTIFGFAPYSPYWREMRKIATTELLSNRRLDELKHVRMYEIDVGLNELYGLWAKNVVNIDLKRWFEDLTFNMTVRMVARKRYYFGESSIRDDESEAKRCQKAINQFFHLIGLFTVSDAVPLIGSFLDWRGHEKEMKKTAMELDLIIGGWVKEHRRQRRKIKTTDSESEHDFIDVMLSLEEEGYFLKNNYNADVCTKATALSLIIGGSDTTSATLTWAVALLLSNRDTLKKAQDELDQQVGMDRKVNESDIKNLVYLHAITKETLRLYPAGPLLGPHEAMEDCTINGYQVSTGTRLIVNVWKIQRDPSVWENPSAFKPERFLTTHVDVDVRGQHFELIPFGSGRRACPGASFALQVISLTLARLLHAFDLETPLDQPIDMAESPGFTTPKATPLEVLLSPRLPHNPYGFSK